MLLLVLVTTAGCLDPSPEPEAPALAPPETDPTTAGTAPGAEEQAQAGCRGTYHDHVEAWIQGTTATNLDLERATHEIRLPVEAGARNATVHVRDTSAASTAYAE